MEISIALKFDSFLISDAKLPSPYTCALPIFLVMEQDETIKVNITIKHFLFIIIKPILNPKYTAINQHNFLLELGNEASGSQFYHFSTHNFAEI